MCMFDIQYRGCVQSWKYFIKFGRKTTLFNHDKMLNKLIRYLIHMLLKKKILFILLRHSSFLNFTLKLIQNNYSDSYFILF